MTWRTALRLGRVSNLPTVWTNALAGAALVGAAPSAPTLLAVLGALSLFYTGGMYLNDAFDREIDARERPERPIPAGLVSARGVFAAGAAMLLLAPAILTMAASIEGAEPAAALACGAALAGAIVFYDARHKGFAWSPLVMATCRALVYLSAALCFAAAGAGLPASLAIAALGLFAYVTGLTYVAAQENLREVKNLWPLGVLGVSVACAAAVSGASVAALALIAALIAWTGYALSYLRAGSGRDVGGAVVRMIAGISLFDAAVIAGTGATAMAVAAACGLVLTRLLQRFVPGT